MKVYYFTVIAIGLMFVLYFGGVQTNSQLIVNTLAGNNPENWSSGVMWAAAIIAFAAFGSSHIALQRN